MRWSTFRQESAALTALSAPIALTQLAQVALTATDTVMMGILGTGALAAGGLAVVLFNNLRTMGVGLVTALGNQVAAVTAGSSLSKDTTSVDEAAEEQTRDLVRAAFVVATLAALAGIVVLVGLGQALAVLGQDPAVVDAAQPMMYALAPGLLPCLWFQVIRHFTVGMRRPKALVRITVASIAVNVVLNLGFINGTWVLPELGLAGIGLATSIVYLFQFLALYAWARRDPLLAPMISLRAWRAGFRTVRRLLGLGVPVAATYGSEAGFFSVVTLIIGGFGAPALAAHTAVNQLIYTVFQVSVGLSHGSSMTVSRAVAQGDLARAGRIGRVVLIHSAVAMSVVALVYLLVPQLVLRPFFDPAVPADAAGAAVALNVLMVAVVLQYFDSAQNIGVGLLRGLDDTKAGFRMTLIGYWAVGIPAAWLAGQVFGWGAVGVWIGLLAGLAVTAALLLSRYYRELAARSALPAAGISAERATGKG